jgi:hypothetical protein
MIAVQDEPSGFVHVHVVAASRSVASASRGSFDFIVAVAPRKRASLVTAPVKRQRETERDGERQKETERDREKGHERKKGEEKKKR